METVKAFAILITAFSAMIIVAAMISSPISSTRGEEDE